MPPKKKPRLSSRATLTPSRDAIENPKEQLKVPMTMDAAESHVLSDPWTDEQETSLFKAVIRWKPVGLFPEYQWFHRRFASYGDRTDAHYVGMHKHFRMIAISEHLRNHGYTSPRDDHTRIPHIWEKLKSLYNLEALDERVCCLSFFDIDQCC
jgi:MRG-binding protein